MSISQSEKIKDLMLAFIATGIICVGSFKLLKELHNKGNLGTEFLEYVQQVQSKTVHDKPKF